MARRHYALPPLTSLAAFEAAARHLSFKSAAAELNVTPGAVSHQVKALERELGQPLFARRHRGVALTEAGQDLAAALGRSFAGISDALARVRAIPAEAPVTIAATTAVSSMWLTPRLTQFWQAHGEVRVSQQVTDAPLPPGADVDLAIVYGLEPDIAPGHRRELYRDRLVPLARPGTAVPDSLQALAAAPLVHLDAGATRWTVWADWFAALGYEGPIAPGFRVNNYAIACQAAEDGAGIVLGWERLTAPLIARGALAPLGSFTLPAPEAFHLVSRLSGALRPPVRRLADWLEAHA